MKSYGPWILLFIILLPLGWLVDPDGTKLGIPVFVWLAVNLTVFLYILARLVGQPMAGFLDARRESIATQLEQAKEKLAQAEELKTEVLSRLDKVENEVGEIQERAKVMGQAEAEKIAEQSVREQERFLRRVDEEISRRYTETRAGTGEGDRGAHGAVDPRHPGWWNDRCRPSQGDEPER